MAYKKSGKLTLEKCSKNKLMYNYIFHTTLLLKTSLLNYDSRLSTIMHNKNLLEEEMPGSFSF